MTPRLAATFAALAVFLVGAFLFSRREARSPDAAAVAATRPTRETTARDPGSPREKPAGEPATASVARPANTPAEILARLKALKVSPKQPQSIRQLIVELENLKAAGPAALPAIRELLSSGEDVDYDAAAKGNLRDGKVPSDFMVPPSLRLGLLEVVKNIGGAEAEALLVQELKTTGRGVEVAYL
ncbi:MAG TPA: hypothetical protein VM029_17865, partial [Opitutaceae bacterium]|nr:hypothetical protein [Opitutaceae bacterium]